MRWIPFVFILGVSLASAQTTQRALLNDIPFGVNFSSLQGTPDTLPGHLNGEVFVTPESHFAYYAEKGLTHIRLEGSWERLQPRLSGPLGEQLLDHYDDAQNALRNPVKLVHHYLDLAQKYKLKVILDLCHNYGRRFVGYDGSWKSKSKAELGSKELRISAFLDFQVKVVKEFGQHPAVIAIELMNEPHDLAIGANGWKDACQQSIDAIRAIDKKIAIVIDGYGWSNAEFWAERNPNLHKLRDPSNRLIFSAHQYFDQNSSGTYLGEESNNPLHDDLDLGKKRIEPFLRWIKQHKLEGHAHLGEFGAPNSRKWSEIVRRTILHACAEGLMLTAHEDVPYKNDPYVLNTFPRDGEGDRYIIQFLQSAADRSPLINKPIELRGK